MIEWYTARELAELAIEGFPLTESAVIRRARRDNWSPSRKRAGTKATEYHICGLPAAVREALLDRQISALPAAVCALPETQAAPVPALPPEAAPVAATAPKINDLKFWQTRTMDARLAFVRLLERATVSVGLNQAVATLVAKSRTGTLPDELARLVTTANARSGDGGGKRTLSRSTLMRWWMAYKNAGGDYAALAPASVERIAAPPWAAAFLQVYRQPQKPTIPDALERMTLPPGIARPSEHQARRFLKKFSRLDVQRGRKSGSELRGQRLYRERDTSAFQPLDIVCCDGHSFKAYVAHPAHGRPFHPEICACIDAVTRAVVGWSVGLAESAMTVADALRHVCTVSEDKPVGGLPLFFYTDGGAGNTAAVNADDIAGLFARLGIEFKTGRAGNPMGNGRIERLNATLWIPAAKRLPTFTGKGMDSLARRKVYLQLQKDVRRAEREERDVQSELLISWADFVEFITQEVDTYNRRPHRSLPRITDSQTGLRRNMTPLEAWADWMERGWRPELMTEEERESIFRPHTTVTCGRGMVRLFKQVYSDPVLEHYHGMQVLVGYDIHDPSRVWVRDEAGRLIVIARRDAHKSSFFPVPVVEMKREERAKGRVKRLERRLEEVELERRGGPIEARVVPEVIEIEPELEERAERRLARQAAKTDYLPENDFEAAEKLREERAAGQILSEKEEQWLGEYDAWCRDGLKRGLLRAGWQPFAARRKATDEGEEVTAVK